MSEGAAKGFGKKPEPKEERRKFQAIKGTRDLLPPETALWNRVEQAAQEIFASYGFGEIRLPIFETTDLFARSIGLETDVVSKEMYTFGDRDETSVSLRPEATASVCRAYIEDGMQQLPQPVKLYTIGPMFRRERPQKGRYRQFYQIDAEVLGGSDAPGIDGELIEMDQLGPDSQRRIETNPLRVLDSKLENEQKLIAGMPHIADHLCEACAENYRGVKKELELRGVKYRENWRLVRGLDYYSRTTFEITAKGLGSQNAVCGGGRYDGLMELLGGPPTRATGFAIGEDRLILSLQETGQTPAPPRRDVYIAWMGTKVYATAIRAARNLRTAGFSVELPPVEQKFGKALGQADKLGARYALILGDNEVSSGEWTLKTLADGTQQKLTEPQLLDFLRNL
ncbi:MAG: histidine--tRNA ligase [Acidobacteria bacterium]|nr:MAG: histidine--tRNA ligase [Acidobacteriota bacterium]